MYIIDKKVKSDPLKRWNLPDRVFFACGACQVLAYAFLEKFPEKGFYAEWIKPAKGFTGKHIFVTDGEITFDYHGFTTREKLLNHTFKKARLWFPDWDAEIIQLPQSVLINEKESKTYDGLWLRQPDQFLYNALPRAEKYLKKFTLKT